MATQDEASSDSLRNTLRNLIAESEALLGQVGEEGSRRYRHAARSLDAQLQRAREDIDDLHQSTLRRARKSIERADSYVRENPWQTSAGAAATGILVGALLAFLLTRRDD